MGLFKIFVPKTDPIVVWKTEAGLGVDFEFDFDQHTLSGIKVGDPISLLWKLGPSEDKAAEVEGFYNYYSKGVQIEVENGLITSFILFWNDQEQKKFLPFSGRSIYGGQSIELRAGTSEAEIESFFGKPERRDEDADEVVLFYRTADVEREVEIDRNYGLTAIAVLR